MANRIPATQSLGGLGLSVPESLSGQCLPVSKSKSSPSPLVRPRKFSRASPELYWPHEAGGLMQSPGGLLSSLNLSLPQSPRGGMGPHQGRGVSCCRGRSHRCRRCRRAEWARSPRPAGSVRQTLFPPGTDAGPPRSWSSCRWRELGLGPGPRLWLGTGMP